MEKWYIYFNIILVILLVVVLLKGVLPVEKDDMRKIDRYYQTIKNNEQCLNYLQTVTSVPTWRFSLLASAGFTVLELILYIIAGGSFDKPKYFLMFWILYILNFIFLYKMIATRDWHYTCSDGCMKNWDPRLGNNN